MKNKLFKKLTSISLAIIVATALAVPVYAEGFEDTIIHEIENPAAATTENETEEKTADEVIDTENTSINFILLDHGNYGITYADGTTEKAAERTQGSKKIYGIPFIQFSNLHEENTIALRIGADCKSESLEIKGLSITGGISPDDYQELYVHLNCGDEETVIEDITTTYYIVDENEQLVESDGQFDFYNNENRFSSWTDIMVTEAHTNREYLKSFPPIKNLNTGGLAKVVWSTSQSTPTDEEIISKHKSENVKDWNMVDYDKFKAEYPNEDGTGIPLRLEEYRTFYAHVVTISNPEEPTPDPEPTPEPTPVPPPYEPPYTPYYPTPDPTPVAEVETVEIADEEVPLAALPQTNEIAEDIVTIIDEDVPLGKLPKAGGIKAFEAAIGGLSLLALALLALFAKRTKSV